MNLKLLFYKKNDWGLGNLCALSGIMRVELGLELGSQILVRFSFYFITTVFQKNDFYEQWNNNHGWHLDCSFNLTIFSDWVFLTIL